jgi:hypothetical protein
MRRIRATLAAAASIPLLLAMATSAFAASPSQAPLAAGRHCVNHLEHIAAGRSEAKITATTCFDSFAAAFRYMTRGQVSVPSTLRPDQVTPEMLQAGPLSVVVLGTDWGGDNYTSGGFGDMSSINWEASSTCTASLSWTVTYVGNNYNDKISSAKSYGGCHRFNHFEDGGFGGSVRVCQPNCSTMGVMNNQTSSLSWDY